jgi:hypothetical protein
MHIRANNRISCKLKMKNDQYIRLKTPQRKAVTPILNTIHESYIDS